MRSQGVCHGYDARSDIDLQALREGTGPALEVRLATTVETEGDLIGEWKERPGNPFHGRLLQRGEGRFSFWASDTGWYEVDTSVPRISVSAGASALRREIRMWGIPTTLCIAARGDLSLHASAVEIDGQAVLLAAPGQHGKTTLAAALMAAGHRLLAEDTISCDAAGGPLVYPGPAVLRMRPDVVDRIEVPGTQVVIDDEDRQYRLLDTEERGSGDALPLGAVIFLRRSDGRPNLQRVPPERAVPDLWSLSFVLPNDASRAAAFDALARISSSIPIFDLGRPMTFDALPEVIETVESAVR
jgi:hypothetical protein